MKDIMNVAVVTYEPRWGDKERNLNRITGYIECAAARGANLVVLPETALTGYDADLAHEGDERMHHRLAEPIPGPSTEAVAEVTHRLGVYAVFGLAERAESGTVYNSAAACGPDGVLGRYRKMHLPADEPTWAGRGDEPFMFGTPWGPVGVSICYDTFVFSEIMRYYRANGCRIIANPFAVNTGVTARNIKDSLEYLAANNDVYIASANCTGCALTDDFVGGSSVIGPGKNVPAVHYYAGGPCGAPGSDEQELHLGTVDLSYVDKPFLAKQWADEDPDFRPDVYARWYAELAEQERFKRYGFARVETCLITEGAARVRGQPPLHAENLYSPVLLFKRHKLAIPSSQTYVPYTTMVPSKRASACAALMRSAKIRRRSPSA